jgi:acyl-CoA synthetase (AMP-forming)/AMP-acid ligase II
MIFRSHYPDVEIPNVSVLEHILGAAAGRGEKPAIVDGLTGRTITYVQLDALVRRAAAGLAARGFRKGDVLAIYSPNLPEYAVAVHAAAALGVVVTTVNPLYTPGELARQLVDSKARAVLTVPAFLDNARAAAAEAGVTDLYVFGDAPEGSGAEPFLGLLAHGDAPPATAIDPAEDLMFLPYSSGTTGTPKGVMLTHRNIVANVAQFTACAELVSADDVVIAVLPFFHIYGLVVVMAGTLHMGGTLVTLPRFDLEGFLSTIERQRVTVIYAAPPMVLALAKHPAVDRYDLSSLRMVLSGAAPLDEGLARMCAERLGCDVRQGYGMTEASPVTHIGDVHQTLEHVGTVGRTAPNTETLIVGLETGEPVGVGMEGEVWVRGPQVMRGYLNRPDATAATVDAEGWLHTGDVGFVDSDGFLHVVDRVKELIKYKGLQVAPAELEAVLLAHPGVADAAVIPVPDECAGEVPKAYVVPRAAPADADAFVAELMEHVASRVAPHKKVRALELTDAIPKSASGKILRRVLVARERERAESSLPGSVRGAAVV